MSTTPYIDKDLYAIGDHLIVERTLYTHHGLYAGNGQVIENLLSRGIVYVSLEEFAHGVPIRVRNHPCPKYNGLQALKRAQSLLGVKQYSLTTFNCEHFVNWCIEGVETSRQVDNNLALIDSLIPSVDDLPVIGTITKQARKKSIMGHLATNPNDYETSAHFDLQTQIKHMQEDTCRKDSALYNGFNLLLNWTQTERAKSLQDHNLHQAEAFYRMQQKEQELDNIHSINDIFALAENECHSKIATENQNNSPLQPTFNQGSQSNDTVSHAQTAVSSSVNHAVSNPENHAVSNSVSNSWH